MTEDEHPYQAENATRCDDDLLEAVEEHEPAPTRDVVKAVGWSQRTTARRFKRLEERGKAAFIRSRP